MSQFAAAVDEALKREDMSIAELGELLETSYEYTRKLCRGLAFPSRSLLRQICQICKLDYEAMRSLIIADRLHRKYGRIPPELTGKSERAAKIERLLGQLTDLQFEQLEAILTVMARQAPQSDPNAIYGMSKSPSTEETKKVTERWEGDAVDAMFEAKETKKT